MTRGVYVRTKPVSKETRLKMSNSARNGKNHWNWKGGITKKDNFCIDCGSKLSDYKAKRCKSCATKESVNRLERRESVSGQNCSFYIDGRHSKQNHCIDCNAEIGRKAERCKSCKAKYLWENNKYRERMCGENHPNWNPDLNRTCIDCGREISLQNNLRCNSCSSKEKWRNKDFRKKNRGNEGGRHSKATMKKMRLIRIKSWESGVYDGVFQSPTKPEKNIINILDKLKIEYIFQFRPENYHRIYDFYIKDKNLLIEFDGIYWHSLPKAIISDKEKTEYAKEHGYKLLRFNENDLADFEKAIQKIIKPKGL